MRTRRRTVIAMLNDPATSTATYQEASPAPTPHVMTMSTKTRKRPAGSRSKSARKKKTGETVTPDPDPGLVDWLRRQLFRPKVLMVLAALLVAIAVVPQIWKRMPSPADRSEYRLAVERIEITPMPRHVPVDLVEQVAKRSNLPETLSLLDENVAKQIALAFERHPWVAEVVEVRKSYPAKIEVELKFRSPAAMVAVPGGLYPIDPNGVLLPPIDFSVADTKLYPVVRGVQSPPPAAEGTRWRDPAVIGAAQLAELLRPNWKKLDLAAIRLPQRQRSGLKPGDLSFELETRGGSRILWGRAPASDNPGELKPEQKIGRLQKYLADFGSFDAPHGPYEIDIRHWQEISRRPLSAGRGMSAKR